MSARRVVLALPRALAAGIRFDPVLPADHALLIHQVPAGTEVKMVAVYDEPFWRADGVCGATVATDDDDRGHARHLPTRPSPGRHRRLLRPGRGPAPWRRSARANVVTAFLTHAHHPPRAAAASPVDVLEQNWAEEQWTRGCSMGHFPTGVLTQYGRRLREPVGRVHWAGTETAVDVVRGHGRRGALGRAGVRGDPDGRESSRAFVTATAASPYGPMPSGRGPGPEPTPSFSRKKVSVWSSAARVGVPSLSTRCSVSTECAFLGCP